jgi:hypothetical protein
MKIVIRYNIISIMLDVVLFIGKKIFKLVLYDLETVNYELKAYLLRKKYKDSEIGDK